MKIGYQQRALERNRARRQAAIAKDNAVIVHCAIHGTSTTWGELSYRQKLAVQLGIDTLAEYSCLFLPESKVTREQHISGYDTWQTKKACRKVGM